MSSLHEDYRPKRWEDVVGQDKAVGVCKTILKRGAGGRALWFSGKSGTGKTTMARLLASELADDFGIDEIDAGVLTPALLRELEDGMRFRGMVKPGRVVIVNEAHGLRKDTIRLLLVTLERLPEYATFIFTTTNAGQQSLFENDVSGDAEPLLSRCTEIPLADDSATRQAFARRAREIAVKEGIDGLPPECYAAATSTCNGNMRKLLMRIESGLFLVDAAEMLRKELDMIRSTKGPNAEARRAAITAALAKMDAK